jgi:hypothetical protein
MRELPLTNGGVALVDDDIYEQMLFYEEDQWFKWQDIKKDPEKDTWYVCKTVRAADGLSPYTSRLYLHRYVMGLEPGDSAIVDHRNGNGLDCRRENLRLATITQNNRNIRRRKDNCSGYKGVRALPKDRWQARIAFNGQNISVLCLDTKHEAGYAYNVAAQLLFDEFAWLNLISDEFLPTEEKRQEIEEKVRRKLLNLRTPQGAIICPSAIWDI